MDFGHRFDDVYPHYEYVEEHRNVRNSGMLLITDSDRVCLNTFDNDGETRIETYGRCAQYPSLNIGYDGDMIINASPVEVLTDDMDEYVYSPDKSKIYLSNKHEESPYGDGFLPSDFCLCFSHYLYETCATFSFNTHRVSITVNTDDEGETVFTAKRGDNIIDTFSMFMHADDLSCKVHAIIGGIIFIFGRMDERSVHSIHKFDYRTMSFSEFDISRYINTHNYPYSSRYTQSECIYTTRNAKYLLVHVNANTNIIYKYCIDNIFVKVLKIENRDGGDVSKLLRYIRDDVFFVLFTNRQKTRLLAIDVKTARIFELFNTTGYFSILVSLKVNLIVCRSERDNLIKLCYILNGEEIFRYGMFAGSESRIFQL